MRLKSSGRKVKRSWRNGIAGVLVIAAAVWGQSALPRERLLLDQARSAFNIANRDSTNYAWISDHEALCLEYQPDAHWFAFVRRNIVTQARSPLTALNARYHQALKAYPFSVRALSNGKQIPITGHISPVWTLSPDGNRLLLTPYDPTNKTVRIVSDLDGVEEGRWSTLPIGEPSGWTADSRHWFDVLNNFYDNTDVDRLLVYDANDPRGKTIILLPNQVPFLYPAGVSRRGEILIISLSSGASSRSELTRFGINAPRATPVRTTVLLPRRADVLQCLASPYTDQIAWLLSYDQTPPIAEMLHRVLRSYVVHSQPTLGVWVSDMEGRNMHEVGHMRYDPNDVLNPAIVELEWLPDGHRLSFIHSGVVYTVPSG